MLTIWEPDCVDADLLLIKLMNAPLHDVKGRSSIMVFLIISCRYYGIRLLENWVNACYP